jgi:PAS domain S-box-containing protein
VSQKSRRPDSPPPFGEGEGGNAAELRARIAELREEVDRLRGRIDREVYERKRAADQVAHLFRVSASVLVAPDLDEQLERVANGIVTACNFRRCVITLIDDDWQVRKRAHAGLSREEAKALESAPTISPEVRRRMFDERYRVGNSYFIPHDSSLGSQLSRVGVSSSRSEGDFIDWHPEDLLFLPLLGGEGKMLGSMSVDDPFDGRRPTAESLTVLELFAREAAFAIEQSLLLRELRKTEGYLENFVTHSADAIIATDPKGKITLWNEGATRMLGWTSEEMIGESVVKVYGNEAEASAMKRLLMSEGHGGAGLLDGYETAFVSKAGEKIPAALSASALYDEDGTFLGTAGISRDLRPWKRLEQEMVAAERAATVGEVAATLCHEINNFLEEILSAGQISLLNLDLPEIREMYESTGRSKTLGKEMERLEVISREALKIAGLTNQLQKLARGDKYQTTQYVGEIRMVELGEKSRAVAGAKILVADDRKYVREFLKDFLALEGFEVDVAEDGRQAIEMAGQRRYDLVLSDIKMPHKNGYEVFAGVKEVHPDTKVILMTAYGYDPSHSIVKASRDGLSAVLYKPFQMARVRNAIVQALAENGGAGEEAGPPEGGGPGTSVSGNGGEETD